MGKKKQAKAKHSKKKNVSPKQSTPLTTITKEAEKVADPFSLTYEPQQTHVNFYDPELNTFESLSIANACERFGVSRWTNTVSSYMAWDKLTSDKKSKMEALVEESVQTQEKLAITPIQDGFEGYGVITKAFIPKGSMLIYAGEIRRYLAPFDVKDRHAIVVSKKNKILTVLTAQATGNIARFFSHAPSHSNAKKYIKFASPEVEQDVAYANFTQIPCKTSQCPISVLSANRDIEAGETVTIDYGMSHFQLDQNMPVLFKRDGSVLPISEYQWLNPRICINVGDTNPTILECEQIKKEGYANSALASLDDLLKGENYVLIELHKLGIEVYIHAYYFNILLNTTPELLTQTYFVLLQLPAEPTPYIKYLPTTQGKTINHYLCDHFNAIMKNDHPDWLSVDLPDFMRHDLSCNDHKILPYSHELYPIETKSFRVLFADKVSNLFSLEYIKEVLQSVGVDSEIMVSTESTPTLLINEISLFSSLHSMPVPDMIKQKSTLVSQSIFNREALQVEQLTNELDNKTKPGVNR